MNLVLLDPAEVSASGECRVADQRSRHLRDVLRVTIGSAIRVGVIDGPLGTATVTSVADTAVDLRCRFETETPSPPGVDLLLAMPRPKVMRRLWAQLAALGVGRILITNAERVERNYFDAHILTAAEYRPLLIEGLQQVRDTRLPIVTVHRQLKVLVEDHLGTLCPDTVRLVADPGDEKPVQDAVAGAAERRVLLAVGPEGGWNDYERGLFAAHGFAPVGLGARTLRTDTACIALLALVHEALRTATTDLVPKGY